MAEGTRSEQLAQKVTPEVREKLDEVLKKMGHYDTGKDGHIKWDQEVLEEIIAILEEKYIMDGHDNYGEVIRAINQYTALINTKLISLIGDLDTSEARIRSEYEKQITSKDEIIKDLQEQKSSQESLKKSAIEDASKSKDAQTIAEKRLADITEILKKSEEAVSDKESIIQTLSGKLKESEEKLDGYDALRKSEADLRGQVSQLLYQKEMLQRDLAEQKRATEQERELAIERATTKTLNAMQDQLEKLRDEMQDQLTKLRDEKIRLEVQLELLQKNTQK